MGSTLDTIFALSSGPPPAAIAVVRISGPRAGAALKAMMGRIPPPRQAAFARLRDADGGEIDQAVALWFPGPNSETGEDVAELQPHGGRAVIAAVLAALGKMDGLRLAEPGEFTRRGFENGKLDLTAIEGLADLIGAETEAQRRQAYRHLTGFLGQRTEAWRQQLIETLALVEARIDFSDEGDVPQDLLGPALTKVDALADEIEAALADGRRGERLRDGMVVAIAGPPNAGKSTLLNRIARREAAIVSPIPGTTRDVIELHLDLDGYPVTLLDTAGIRDTTDPVEMEGVRRARERAAAADLTLWVVDSDDASRPNGFSAALNRETGIQSFWLVQNKADQSPKRNERRNKYNNDDESVSYKNEVEFISRETPHFRISALTGEGFDQLVSRLAQEAARAMSAEPSLIARERHRTALGATAAALRRALAEPARSRDDLLAEELRTAATALGRLTGRIDVEDILDVIFRDFCIGK